MNTRRILSAVVLVGLATALAVRECRERSQSADLRAILAGSYAYTWSPQMMESHRVRSAPAVRRYQMESRLWTGAGWMLIALSPRKAYISVYAHPNHAGRKELMAKLGKCSGGKSCINIKRLSDVHLPTLNKIIVASVAAMRKDYPA